MANEGKNIAKLNFEIDRAELKKIADAGKLKEFAEKAAALAADEIKMQILDELSKSATKASAAGKPLSASISVSTLMNVFNDDFGTHCKGVFCKTYCITPRDVIIKPGIDKKIITR
jgi:hypothetical protein